MRLAASNDGIDHTGEIISFTAIGTGAGAANVPPRPWVCFTTGGTNNVVWQFPDGLQCQEQTLIATGDQLTTRVGDRFVLSRGRTHNSPDILPIPRAYKRRGQQLTISPTCEQKLNSIWYLLDLIYLYFALFNRNLFLL